MAEKKNNEEVEETTAEATPEVVEETTPEAPAADAETPAPVDEAPAAEETPAEEPVAAEAEGPAEIEPEVEAAEADAVEEPVVESDSAAEPEAAAAEEPAAANQPAPADEPEAAADAPADESEPEAAPAPAGKRPKSQKHLPRSQRRQRSKPEREKPAERKPIVRLDKPAKEIGRHQERRGIVVSDVMDKTIVVKVDVIRIHPRYKKVIRRSRKFHAHDEQNQAHVGDTVRIVETRPLSKTKNWRLAEVVEVAK
jgi:small subunit ribosomal protein S17